MTESALEEPLEESVCRICYESEGILIQPCDCKGSTGNVHKECLEKWINVSKRRDCEICHFEYDIIEEKQPLMIFSNEPNLNKQIPLMGVLCLLPASPIAHFVGVQPLDVYFGLNLGFCLLTIALMRRIKILPTLTLWKFCLTLGDTVVAVKTNSYEYVYFDWTIVLFFAFITWACYRRENRINNRTPDINDLLP